jgi:hypothetical protein
MVNRRIRLADSASAPSDDKTQGDVASWDVATGIWQLGRRMRYAGAWEAGTYHAGDVVTTVFGLMVATATTTEVPVSGAADWDGLTFYGIAGMSVSTPVATADWGLAYIPLDQFDNVDVDGPGVDLDVATGRWVHTIPGFWDIRLQLFFSHNSSNQGRTTFLRVWDTIGGAEVGAVPFGIARNQEDSSISITLRAGIDDTVLNNPFRFEVGGGSDITTVTIENMAMALTWVCPYFAGEVAG